MLRLLRIALQMVLFFLLLSAVSAIAVPETGVVEKAVLVALGAGLIWLASLVRRIGGRPTSQST
jgi:hypothetical protein